MSRAAPPAACLQALHFTGDLSAGDIQPQSQACPLTPEQQLRLARRRSALLSMPIECPQAAASGRNSSSSSGSGGGGLFGWMDAATQPWTPAGRPDPEPLTPKQVRTPCTAAAVNTCSPSDSRQLGSSRLNCVWPASSNPLPQVRSHAHLSTWQKVCSTPAVLPAAVHLSPLGC
jgi:hypothetical protein